MGWGVLVLVSVQAVVLCFPPRAAATARDGLPPCSLQSSMDCADAECGQGRCKLNTSHTLGFVCECDPGWTKPTMGGHFQFLPCVIPNCTLDFSCSHKAATPTPAPAPAPLPSPPPSNRSLLDPCSRSYCGGGTCVKTTNLGHRCECSPGFGNLLNVTNLPCFRECVLGTDCARLGIVLPNGSSPSPAFPPGSSGSAPNRAAAKSPESSIWFSLLMVSMAMVVRT